MGSVRASMRLEFNPSANKPIEVIDVAIKRGNIFTLKTMPNRYKMNEMSKSSNDIIF